MNRCQRREAMSKLKKMCETKLLAIKTALDPAYNVEPVTPSDHETTISQQDRVCVGRCPATKKRSDGTPYQCRDTEGHEGPHYSEGTYKRSYWREG